MKTKAFKKILKMKYGTGAAEKVAKELGIDPSTFYRKMNRDGEEFTIKQMRQLIAITGMTEKEALDIFLNSELADTQESA